MIWKLAHSNTGMHAKFLIWKTALRMRRSPEVRNLASQKFRLTRTKLASSWSSPIQSWSVLISVMYAPMARTSNYIVIPMEWSWWVASNNACEASEHFIVQLANNGDDKSELVNLHCCLLPQCEALHTCCSGFLTAAVAQRISGSVYCLFCFM